MSSLTHEDTQGGVCVCGGGEGLAQQHTEDSRLKSHGNQCP